MGKKTTVKSAQGHLAIQMREIIGDAYGFVRGREYTKSVANTTYEQLLDAAIDRIEGTPERDSARATVLGRVQRIKQLLSDAVITIKARPPHEWSIESDDQPRGEEAMNTEENPPQDEDDVITPA